MSLVATNALLETNGAFKILDRSHPLCLSMVYDEEGRYKDHLCGPGNDSDSLRVDELPPWVVVFRGALNIGPLQE